MGSSSSKYSSSTRAAEVAPEVDVKGKTVIVTGANTGIGYETARVLASRGAEVIIACRNQAKAADAAARIKKDAAGSSVEVMELDLGSLASVEAFAAAFKATGKPLNLLINNAGIMALPKWEDTQDGLGIEKQWAVNHLGHFHLTNLLLEPLRAGAPSRVVNVASMGHKGARKAKAWGEAIPIPQEKYNDWVAYGDSKMSNILFARELNKREGGNNVTAYSLHPGMINTELARNSSLASFFYTIGQIFMKSIPQGAATTLFCALDDEARAGGYHSDCKFVTSSRSEVTDDEVAATLWRRSEELVAAFHEKNSAVADE